MFFVSRRSNIEHRLANLLLGVLCVLGFLGCGEENSSEATVRGRVTDLRGQALSQVNIVVRSATGDQTATTSTDNSGSYEVREIFQAGETYDVIFNLTGFEEYTHTETLSEGANPIVVQLTPSHCIDRQINADETGIDCGGSCVVVCVSTCSDNIQNGDESGVDCGGQCPACTTDLSDAGAEGDSGSIVEDLGVAEDVGPVDTHTGIDTGTDDVSTLVDAGVEDSSVVDVGIEDTSVPEPTCTDGEQNGDEARIDCGGSCPDICTERSLRWRNVTPATGNPPARYQHAMVSGVQSGDITMFGGAIGFTQQGSDTWLWNGSQWVDASAAVNPPARYTHAMASNTTDGVVALFAGRFGGVNPTVLSDFWLWNGTDWQSISLPADGPLARFGHAMAHDSVNNSFVVFGGRDNTNRFSDTWMLQNNTWTHLTPTTSASPEARSSPIAFDSQRGRFVMFGGLSENVLGDTWEWDGTRWLNVTPSDARKTPPPRHSHALVYDSSRQKIILFGGFDRTRHFDDTWEWDGREWIRIIPPTGNPPQRMGHAMAYDSVHQQMVVFGGFDGRQFFADTWVLESID